MLLDPSHMSGDASQVPALMVKVAELGLDGAMIEVHCKPEEALSDAHQQIIPTCLRDTLNSIPSRFRVVAVFWILIMGKWGEFTNRVQRYCFFLKFPNF